MSQNPVNQTFTTSMEAPTARSASRPIRLLVAIASFGGKNLEHLTKIIRTYQSMTMEVHIVVFSNIPKNLGAGVEVIVGLPQKNPWSLPFEHKALFAQRLAQYDLFAYSEDDMAVTENNIRAFLRAASSLEAGEIAGFLRYEVAPSGNKSLPDLHKHFHWNAESVRQREDYTTAEFTNEHAAFYLLTQTQLKKAIASGGFLQGPNEGRYGLPETAATDPYTRCGFRKVICISHLEDFLIHHMSNFYVNRYAVSLATFKEQIGTLANIRDGLHPARTLCKLESRILHGRWSKYFDEKPCAELLTMLPETAQSILSVGCGSGALEAELIQRGMTVTALPLDSVIGAAAARLGIQIIYGNWNEAMRVLAERKFDCVIVTNLLHLQPQPEQFLKACALRVGNAGTLLAAGPNFLRLPTLVQRALGMGDYRKLRTFAESGVTPCGPGKLARLIGNSGFRPARVHWLNHEFGRAGSNGIQARFGRFTAKDWILEARRGD